MCELCKLEAPPLPGQRQYGPAQRKADDAPREHKVSPVYITSVDEAQGIVEAVVNVSGILDEGNDIVQRGAFTKTLTERGLKVKVLDNHRADSVMRVVGKVLEAREVGRDALPANVLAQWPEATGGLWTKTQYLLNTPEGEGVFRRIAAGAVDEYSIGYTAMQVDYQMMSLPDGRTISARILKELRLYEYSPVIFGMNPATATVGVKGEPHPQADAPTPDMGPDDETVEAPAVEDDPDKTQPLQPVQEAADELYDRAKAWLDKAWLDREAKGAASIGAALMSSVATGVAGMPAFWLAEGVISVEEYGLLNTLYIQAAKMVYNGLPAEMRDRDLRATMDAWSADGPGEGKVGRVLSAKNYELIRSAHEALSTVMSSATMRAAEEEAEAPKSAGRDDAQKAGAEPASHPSSTNENPLTLIERDLIEVERVEQRMIGWT